MGTLQSLKQKLSIRPKIRAFVSSILQNYFEANYSKNIDVELNKRALQTTCDYIEEKMSQVPSFPDKYKVLDLALDHVKIDGIYCEFGVYTGGTLRHIASRTSANIHGFDSFEGLPEDWRGNVGQGHFKLNQIPKFKEENVKLHVGWFDDTLKEFVHTNQQKVAFLHVDCDLYSSTKTIFDLLSPFIVEGTIIVFDEYFNYPCWEAHEFKAFQEFIEQKGLTYSYLCYNIKAEQVAVKIDG